MADIQWFSKNTRLHKFQSMQHSHFAAMQIKTHGTNILLQNMLEVSNMFDI